MGKLREKYIGDKAFYVMLMSVAVPIMVQNGITNFVNLLDNIMVGRIGTEQMSGVAIVNQIMFIYFLCMFGGQSGAGIFTAQFFGYKDDNGIRHTFRYKLWLGLIITVTAIVIMHFFGENLVGLFLNESSDGGDLQATLRYALGYMRIIFFSMPLVLVSFTYSSTLRECGETMIPMYAGLAAVFVNLAFNYLLIYGKLGFPAMGVYGAAIATGISRVVECMILVIWMHTHSHIHTFIRGIYRTMKIPLSTVRQFFVTGAPLLINETLWATGIFLLNQAYSLRGLNAVTDTKIIAASVFIGCLLMVLMIVSAPLFPQLYNTNDEAKKLAMLFLIVQGLATPKEAFLHTTYFTIRSGGKTIITFLFDSVFMCLVSVPLAFVLSRFTSMHVIGIFAIVHTADLIKCVIGYVLVKKNVWMRNIVA